MIAGVPQRGPGSLRHLVTFATNNADIGGGEVMLLELAKATRDLGLEARVVGPPGPVLDAARASTLRVETVEADGRRSYMVGLRRWRRANPGLLWCNGLVPALATAGQGERVVHLHQRPTGAQAAAAVIARRGAAMTLVPSEYLAQRLPGARTLPNWCPPVHVERPPRGDVLRVGFLGRTSTAKGLDVLARALSHLERQGVATTLVLAGAPRFVSSRDRDRVVQALAPIVDRMQHLGWVDREQFFAAVDVAVFPSRWPEPFGLVAIEAMSAKVPFIVSDAGALPEVVGPDHPWTARAGDAMHLAQTIADVGQALPASPVVAEAHARWRAEFSPEAGRGRLATVLHGLGVLAEPPIPSPSTYEDPP